MSWKTRRALRGGAATSPLQRRASFSCAFLLTWPQTVQSRNGAEKLMEHDAEMYQPCRPTRSQSMLCSLPLNSSLDGPKLRVPAIRIMQRFACTRAMVLYVDWTRGLARDLM